MARPRGSLSADQRRRIERDAAKRDQADATYRRTVLAVLEEGASYREVSEATGLSTNTLQRWKRDVSDAPRPPLG